MMYFLRVQVFFLTVHVRRFPAVLPNRDFCITSFFLFFPSACLWYNVRMTKEMMIDIAQRRFSYYVWKIYGSKAKPSEEANKAIARYLNVPHIYERRFRAFLLACDASECYAMLRDEKATEITPDSDSQLSALLHDSDKHIRDFWL